MSLLQGTSSIAAVHKISCLISQEIFQQPRQQTILFPFLQFAENTSMFLCIWWPWKTLLLCSWESFRALLFSASQGSRNCEIISILCLYVPWSCYTAQSEIEIRPQGFASDAFSLSMAHAHSWGATELAFIVLHFSSKQLKTSDFSLSAEVLRFGFSSHDSLLGMPPECFQPGSFLLKSQATVTSCQWFSHNLVPDQQGTGKWGLVRCIFKTIKQRLLCWRRVMVVVGTGSHWVNKLMNKKQGACSWWGKHNWKNCGE